MSKNYMTNDNKRGITADLKKKKNTVLIIPIITLIISILLAVGFTNPQNSVYAATGGSSFGTATPLTEGVPATGSLSGQAQYFKITIKSGKLSLIVGGPSTTATLYDSDRYFVTSITSPADNSSAVKKQLYLMGGTYYVKVYGNSAFSVSYVNSTATESFPETMYTTYDTFATAKAIEFNKQYLGQLGEDDYVDVFSFDVPKAGTISVTRFTRLSSSSGNPHGSIYNAEEESMGTVSCSDAMDETLYTATVAPGRYYFEVSGVDSRYVFRINYEPIATKTNLKDVTIAPVGSKNYTGKALTPAVTLSYEGSTLQKDVDYTVTYSNNKDVGIAKVTIKGEGDYEGTVTKTFKINPKGRSIKSVTPGVKSLTVNWVKQATKMSTSYISGYQIYLSTNSSFTKDLKKVGVSRYTTVSKKITGLKGGVKYYVKLRTYKTIGGTNYYSPWSTVKTVTTKK